MDIPDRPATNSPERGTKIELEMSKTVLQGKSLSGNACSSPGMKKRS
jgi:hypothetical protein